MSPWSLLARSGRIARAFPGSERAVADGPIKGRIRAEQISNVRRYLMPVMIANACNASVLVLALWSSPQRGLAIIWACAILAFTIYHYFRGRRSTWAKATYVSHRPVSRATRNALLLGSLWAILPLIFFSDASAGGKVIIACLCAGTLGGGVFAFASLPAAAIAFTAPIVVGSAIAIGRSGDPAYFLLAVLMVSYVAILWRGVFLHAGEVAWRIAQQIQAERKFRRDELTGLPNRIALFEALDKAALRLASMHEQFAVLYLDLNDFKSINDRLGHAAGDRLLIEVGRRFRSCVGQTDLISRLSGDEFAVVATDIKSSDDAKSLAYALLNCLDASITIDGVAVSTSACAGVAIAPDHGEDRETLLKNADAALYAAKRGTDGVIQLYDAQYRDKGRRRRSLERGLRDALNRNELFLVFQPILSIGKNHFTGTEALLRWNHPKLGVRSPTEFIRILEETGLIHDIGEWVLFEASKAATAWPQDMRVAVNVSARQLRDPSIVSRVVRALTRTTLAYERLEIEITETALIDDTERVISNLKTLRELGVRIALDDFGTGYSSLTYLRKLLPDTIKIDRSFVRDLLKDAGCTSIVKSVIELSHDLGINLVAEGIETVEQLSFLRDQRCEEGQGYLICPPKPASELSFLSARSATRVEAA